MFMLIFKLSFQILQLIEYLLQRSHTSKVPYRTISNSDNS
jgi:hypothetical protein